MTMADGQAALLKPFVESGCADARLALDVPALFGNLAADFPDWARTVQRDLDLLRANGVRTTIGKVLDEAQTGQTEAPLPGLPRCICNAMRFENG